MDEIIVLIWNGLVIKYLEILLCQLRGNYMDRAERRRKESKAIQRRASLMEALGQQSGTVYERHRAKVNKSCHYMACGNVSHYVATKPRRYYDRYKIQGGDEDYG